MGVYTVVVIVIQSIADLPIASHSRLYHYPLLFPIH
jgi:hypothetical protein